MRAYCFFCQPWCRPPASRNTTRGTPFGSWHAVCFNVLKLTLIPLLSVRVEFIPGEGGFFILTMPSLLKRGGPLRLKAKTLSQRDLLLLSLAAFQAPESIATLPIAPTSSQLNLYHGDVVVGPIAPVARFSTSSEAAEVLSSPTGAASRMSRARTLSFGRSRKAKD